jgi:tetrahydromethanopterin S-methyltransferase subunit G
VSSNNAEVMERLRSLEERLDQIQREQRPRGLRNLVARLVPREVRQHLKAARREQLLAVEAYIDHLIKRLDETDEQEQGRQRRRIEVE